MLRRFEVTNFQNFREKFVLDLSDTKNYEFNSDCVENGLVKKGMIYGPNGCGKSNLGHAIFEIQNHLTDEKIPATYENFLNAFDETGCAEFTYVFQFGEAEVIYNYGKKSAKELVFESLVINGEEVISLDRRKSHQLTTTLKGTETLNKDLSSNISLSALKYVINNSVLEDNSFSIAVDEMESFIFAMRKFNLVDMGAKDLKTFFSPFLVEDGNGKVAEFERFLNSCGVKCKLSLINDNGVDLVAFNFGNNKIEFTSIASTGTLALGILFQFNKITTDLITHSSNCLWSPFVFLDEFDAFFHHAAAKMIVKGLKALDAQVILTTHNTGIMTNELLRPDCYFIMSETDVKPMHRFTDKELRKAHNIEKMYRSGAFDE